MFSKFADLDLILTKPGTSNSQEGCKNGAITFETEVCLIRSCNAMQISYKGKSELRRCPAPSKAFLMSLKIANKGVFFIAVSQFGMAFSFHCILAFIPFYILKMSPFGPKETMIWTGMIMGASNVVASFTASFWDGSNRVQAQAPLRTGDVLQWNPHLAHGIYGQSLPSSAPEDLAGRPRRRLDNRPCADLIVVPNGGKIGFTRI